METITARPESKALLTEEMVPLIPVILAFKAVAT